MESEIKEYLEYDKDTGVFAWKRPMKRLDHKTKAGKADKRGYVVISMFGKKYGAHRLAWLFVYGEWPKFQIDHINQNKSDNRIDNLRDVTNKENARNQKLRCTNTSGYIGVYWRKDLSKWEASIKIDGKRVYLGRYKDPVDAAIARKMGEYEHGFHPNHGS